MNTKKVLATIAISIFIMVILLGLVYNFNITLMNISNVFFFVGVFYFFPGLIVVSGAGNIFENVGYLTRKMFFKSGENYFKSLHDYKEYKDLNKVGINKKQRGSNILMLGGVYIVLSIAIGIIA